VLNKDNVLLFASHHYDCSPTASTKDFIEDLSRPKYIKRLFRRYLQTGELRDRIIMNHIIVFYNVFDTKAATLILCYYLREYLPQLKPFLVFLNNWPEVIDLDPPIDSVDVQMDQNIVNVLRKI
jgi:hypothetical protein